MANILLLDDQEVAGRAMRGILARAAHRCLIATRIEDAWKYLREAVLIDLIFVEIRLKSENGFDFIQQLRDNCLFKLIPVVVYTAIEDHHLSKQAFSLKVQCYLTKPYGNLLVHEEVAKACANPWRDRHFEEEKSFCTQMGLAPEGLKEMLRQVQTAIELSLGFFAGCAEGLHEREAILARISALTDQAQNAGFWGLVECLEALRNKAQAGDWTAFKECEDLTFASRLVHCRLDPSYLPDVLRSDAENEDRERAKARAIWLVDVKQTGPVVSPEKVWPLLDRMPGFPVVDTVGAAFQMAADGRTENLTHLMGLTYRDPALAMQVLLAANGLEREEKSPVDDPRLAVNLLGKLKLHALARAMPMVAERDMSEPPINWPRFAKFQLGVAQVADYTCQFLEFAAQQPYAHTAGLLQDIGKLLLLRLYPFGFQAIARHARLEQLPFHEAERRYIGCTSREIACYFASKRGLPVPYCNVIRWVETPAAATEDIELVAVVSLARQLCLHNHVGYCGDTPKDQSPPIAETVEWRVLSGLVFTGFNLAKFEVQVHTYCRELAKDLA